MYIFFSFVGLLMVNHVYILVLWEFCIKKKAQILIWTALSS